MPIGFSCTNDSGAVQVDGEFANITLRQKGSVVCNQLIPGPPENRYYGDVTVTSSGSPMLAIRDTGGTWAFVGHSWRSGQSVTFRIVRATSGSVQWYLFDEPQSAPSSFGLQVFNASGKLVFDSQFLYMRVLEMLYGNIDDYPGGIAARSYPGKAIAVVQGSSSLRHHIQPVPGPQTVYALMSNHSAITVGGSDVGFVQGSTTIVISPDPQQNVGATQWRQRYFSYLVLDVTNM